MKTPAHWLDAPELVDAVRLVLARIDGTNIHTTLDGMRDTWAILRAALAKHEELNPCGDIKEECQS